MQTKFWYSQKQADIALSEDGASLNKVMLPIAGELVELEYTECHTPGLINKSEQFDAYVPVVDDAVLLGIGTLDSISFFGRKPYLERMLKEWDKYYE